MHVGINCLNSVNWGDSSFLTVYSPRLLQNQLTVNAWIYLWYKYSIPLVGRSLFRPVACCCLYLCILFWSHVVWYLQLYSFYFDNSVCFVIPYEIQDIFRISTKNALRILIWIALNLLITLGSFEHFNNIYSSNM